MTEIENTNWCQSVGGVVFKENNVLVARHTYGAGKGKLVIPGGYLIHGEMPEEAVKREVMEETQITAEVLGLIGVRFNQKDWYALFLLEYISGVPTSDNHENNEALFLPAIELLERDDVPDLSKHAIRESLEQREKLLSLHPFFTGNEKGPASLYCI